MVDEKQHVETTQRDRVDVEEVAGERAGCLCAKELPPRRSRSARRRFEAMSSKHVAHARRRENDAELPQLADDAEIASARVLPREPKDECDDLDIEPVRSDLVRTRESPMLANELTVPAQQCCWSDEEGGPTFAREESRERRQHGAISGGEPGTRHLAAEHSELMTKDCDLDVLLFRTWTDSNEAEQLSNEQEGY